MEPTCSRAGTKVPLAEMKKATRRMSLQMASRAWRPRHPGCPECGSRMIYLRSSGAHPATIHTYRCETHGVWSVGPESDLQRQTRHE